MFSQLIQQRLAGIGERRPTAQQELHRSLPGHIASQDSAEPSRASGDPINAVTLERQVRLGVRRRLAPDSYESLASPISDNLTGCLDEIQFALNPIRRIGVGLNDFPSNLPGLCVKRTEKARDRFRQEH